MAYVVGLDSLGAWNGLRERSDFITMRPPTAEAYIIRTTVWEDQDGRALQVDVCILDRQWEPVWAEALFCGPFHSLEERTAELHSQAAAWIALYGLQQSLPLG